MPRFWRYGAVFVAAVILMPVVAAARADATPATVSIVLQLDRGSIRADGRDTATIAIDASVGGNALGGATIGVSAAWTTPKSPGAAKLSAHAVVLDGNGHGVATVTSTRSGAALLTAKIHTRTNAGTASVPLTARRHSMVVFVNGAASTVTCPTPTTCGDSSGLFTPVSSALAAQGFAPADLATFSYAGGSVNPATHGWTPNASTCADSAKSYTNEVGQLKQMLTKLASANPNSDISVVGLSQGGLLAFQTIATSKSLPAGARLANVFTFDAPLGGLPLSELVHLESVIATSCWSLGGSSPAARQIVTLWNTTAPSQGAQQGDRARLMCNVVAVRQCPAETNAQALTASTATVHTWGNTQDAVFNPTACGFIGYPDTTESQVVSVAAGGLHPEGAPAGSSCTIASHTAAVANHAGDVASAIGAQQ